jgi:hypothetical protein
MPPFYMALPTKIPDFIIYHHLRAFLWLMKKVLEDGNSRLDEMVIYLGRDRNVYTKYNNSIMPKELFVYVYKYSCLYGQI